MTIRPFSLGDVLLLHRLSRHATQLHIEKTLLQYRSPLWTVLRTALPSTSNSFITFVLRQQEHGFARHGLIQTELRASRSEAHVTLLAPALDAPQGHPAIWQKLLAQMAQISAERQVNRLYADVPDQPLLVNTFHQAGFQLYARETVWRLAGAPLMRPQRGGSPVRPRRPQDDWALSQLYYRVTPPPVQHAEGAIGPERDATSRATPPILAHRYFGLPVQDFVMEDSEGLQGCLRIVWGQGMGQQASAWLQIWTDTNEVSGQAVRLLLQCALAAAAEGRVEPLYIGVRTYQTGMESLLSELGFVPFTDRARLVRNILQWVQRPAVSRVPALDAVREALPGSLILPKASGVDPGSLVLAGGAPVRPRLSLLGVEHPVYHLPSPPSAQPTSRPTHVSPGVHFVAGEGHDVDQR